MDTYTHDSDRPFLLGDSRFLVSGSADNMMKLWDVGTGKCLYTWEFPTAIKRVAFSEDDNLVACITEQRMGYQGAIRIFKINRSGSGTDQSADPISMFHPIESKATVLEFTNSSDLLVTGHESGKMTLFNTKNGEEVVSNKRAHREVVTDIQMSHDRSYFITSSKDKSAKVMNWPICGKVTKNYIKVIRDKDTRGTEVVCDRDTAQ